MERSAIQETWKWNLDSLYHNQQEFLDDYQKAESLLQELKAKEHHICDTMDCFCAFLDGDEQLSGYIENLYVYAKMTTDVEPENEEYQQNLAIATTFMQKASIELNFATLELIHHKATIETYLAKPQCKDYRYPMQELFRTIPHRLTDKEEQLLSQIGELTSVPAETYQSFRPEFEPVIVNGKEQFLNGATYREFLKNKDVNVRKEAFEHYFIEYKKYENVFANTLIGNAKGQVFMANTRNYKDALEASLFQDDANEQLFQTVLRCANETYRPYLHEYYQMRKQILHLEEQHIYDVSLDMVEQVNQQYEIDESFAILYKALAPLSDEYVTLLKRAKTERWIDFMPSKGKRTGAYSWGTYKSNPYILTNFTGSYESLSTLAHELGHSMHSYFSNTSNRPMLAGYKIFVAEVASTVNEVLLNTYLLQNSEDKKMKAYILANLLEQLAGTLYRQPMFAQFEYQLHVWIQQRQPVSSATLTDYYLKLNQEYFGNSVIVDELQKYGCYYIPHFYYNFYVYKYSVGMAVALSFVKKILAGDAASYLNFLQKGGSEPCIDQLKNAGVDPCSESVYQDAFEFFKETMDQFKALMK